LDFINKHIRFLLLPLLLFGTSLLVLGVHAAEHLDVRIITIDVVTNLCLAAILSRLLAWRIRLYPTKVLSILHANFLAFFAVIILFGLSEFLLNHILLKKDLSYQVYIDQTKYIRFLSSWLSLGWLAHTTVLVKRQADFKRDIELHQNATISLREAELFRLRQQLQPHFLYNSLNSINALILIDAERAQEMVGRLSDFLRLSVRRETQEQTNVLDELTYIESYLCIESLRFGDRLNVVIDKAGDDVDAAALPAFILQPILENAIKFGLYGNVGKVLIKIQIQLKDQLLHITIENPFDSTVQTPRGTGFGLEGIRRRLQLLYARADLLEIQKTENTFTTIIQIPQ
jgi:two-component system, LytTR family, sensor kinase